ncbi:hypothetical protein LCGC14_1099350 [marine sediment metagenome]|uniref:Uncharacterized protein n=1 Tax=marine sediment metagenome TaxID=412755 RepID=A0A0F9MEG6_9ZZZZ
MKNSILCRVIWKVKSGLHYDLDDLILDLSKRGIEFIYSHNDDIPILILKEKEEK